MKELQPVNQNVLLELQESEQVTAGGIIIPDTAKEKPKFARVIGLSNIDNPEISVDDVVYFNSYSGSEVDLEGNNYLIVKYSDILAKLVETDEI